MIIKIEELWFSLDSESVYMRQKIGQVIETVPDGIVSAQYNFISPQTGLLMITDRTKSCIQGLSCKAVTVFSLLGSNPPATMDMVSMDCPSSLSPSLPAPHQETNMRSNRFSLSVH